MQVDTDRESQPCQLVKADRREAAPFPKHLLLLRASPLGSLVNAVKPCTICLL